MNELLQIDVIKAIHRFVGDMSQPCHTFAYTSGHQLDKCLRKFLATESKSDYGHSGLIMDAFKDALNCQSSWEERCNNARL